MASSVGYQSRLDLALQADSVHWARLHTGNTLHGWALHEVVVENAVLIVSELASNAVRHAARTDTAGGENSATPRLTVSLWVAECGLIVAVYDQTRCPPVQQEVSLESESGRGLALVDALSARWGFTYPSSDSGKWVYAVLSPSEGWGTTALTTERALRRMLATNSGVLAAVSA